MSKLAVAVDVYNNIQHICTFVDIAGSQVPHGRGFGPQETMPIMTAVATMLATVKGIKLPASVLDSGVYTPLTMHLFAELGSSELVGLASESEADREYLVLPESVQEYIRNHPKRRGIHINLPQACVFATGDIGSGEHTFLVIGLGDPGAPAAQDLLLVPASDQQWWLEKFSGELYVTP